MDAVELWIEQLFAMQSELEEVALKRDRFGQWSIDLTLPHGTTKRTRIIHTVKHATLEDVFADARRVLRPANLI